MENQSKELMETVELGILELGRWISNLNKENPLGLGKPLSGSKKGGV